MSSRNCKFYVVVNCHSVQCTQHFEAYEQTQKQRKLTKRNEKIQQQISFLREYTVTLDNSINMQALQLSEWLRHALLTTTPRESKKAV